MSDTIAAVATSTSTNSGINIIRISGKGAEGVIKRIFRSRETADGMEPNRMYLGRIEGKNFKERAFCVLYKAPKSYTGEDVAEIHCHGGKGVTNAVLRTVLDNGARLAEAGEFTKRAFLNGKMTLDEAEGVAEIINAETEAQIRNAYKLMSGELAEQIEKTENLITEIIAATEVKMDYPDETEGEDYSRDILNKLDEAIAVTDEIIRHASLSKPLKNGIDIAIIGNPNAGKSSLLNSILREDRAIVTPIAGTTRDVISESLIYRGIKFNFLDTAGIRDGGDEIEKLGIERSLRAAERADIVILVIDSAAEEVPSLPCDIKDKRVIKVYNKIDLRDVDTNEIKISAKDGRNVESVLEKIYETVGGESYDDGVVVNERHLSAVKECNERLKEGKGDFGNVPDECVTVDLYAAAEALGKITGRTVNEEVIDEIFSKFCVGK